MSAPRSSASSPLSPVTPDDLAESLDALLEAIPKNCMGELCRRSTRSEQLLARYHAQQAYLRQPQVAVQQLPNALAEPDSDGGTMDIYVDGKHVGVATDVTIDLERSAAESALREIGEILAANGCECECDHHHDECDDDCERCLGCRISNVLYLYDKKRGAL